MHLQDDDEPLTIYAVINNSTVSRNIIGHQLIEELNKDKKAENVETLFPMSFVISHIPY